MFHVIDNLLTPEEVAHLRQFCASHKFVDGKISNEEFELKNNLQSNLQDAGAQQASGLVQNALVRNEWVRDVCLPKSLAAPMLSKYTPDMHYGEHVDTHLVAGAPPVRVDVSCTIFINDPVDYDGGELMVRMGDKSLTAKEKSGAAVFYPSTQFHRVNKVTRGERLAAITFIQSHIRDMHAREILFQLQDFLHNYGSSFSDEALMQLEFVRTNLLRMWYED
ncbi:MAG: Fe2+-dependent dioxygenase [Marinicaulis sp.]|nr:Fe2+-dependent dioxygenase [Marinicaulis sp.]NNL89968.1 Fe2+-dependent dioxygenase [Marinicaulis sp.]